MNSPLDKLNAALQYIGLNPEEIESLLSGDINLPEDFLDNN